MATRSWDNIGDILFPLLRGAVWCKLWEMLNVEIGSGTCEIQINSRDGIVFSRSLRVGGDAFDGAIVAHLKRAYNLMIGERTAEEIKIQIGSALPLEQELSMEIKARDLSTGVPKAVSVGSQEIREAFHEALSAILESIRLTMARCPPGFSADLAEQGIVLAGGGARLRGLDRLVARETCLPVQIAQARKTSQ